MAWKLSTGMRDKLLEAAMKVTAAVKGTTISFAIGTGLGGADRISDSANGLIGFRVGDYVTVLGSTSNAGKNGKVVAVEAAAGGGYIDVTGASLANEAAGTVATIAAADGGSWRGILRHGVIRIFTGSQPTSPDDAETGTLLCELSESSAVFSPGDPSGGLSLGNVSSGTIGKESGQVWSGENVATGTAGWFRFYANDRTTGASTTAARCDGAVATSGAQLNLTSTSLTSGVTTTADSVVLAQPGA